MSPWRRQHTHHRVLVATGQQRHTSDLAVGDTDLSCTRKTNMSILPCRIFGLAVSFPICTRTKVFPPFHGFSSLLLVGQSYDHIDIASRNLIVCCSHAVSDGSIYILH